jgi:acyl dehydratase
MIDRKFIGHELPPSVLQVERGRLQFFAKAIGETNPVYCDLAAARDAGYADLPAPPTFLFSAELDSGGTERLLSELGVPIAKILHGEQSFSYLKPVVAGDTVTVRSRISDIYDKKNGALEFIIRQSSAVNQQGETVAEMRTVIVVRN